MKKLPAKKLQNLREDKMRSDPNPRVPPADMTSLALIKNRSDLDRTSRGTFGLNTLKNARKSSFWTSSGRTWHLDRGPWTSTEDELAPPLLSLSLFCVLLPGDRQALQCAPCALSVVSMTTKHAQKALKWMKSSEQLTVSIREQSERSALRSVIHPDTSHSTSVE